MLDTLGKCHAISLRWLNVVSPDNVVRYVHCKFSHKVNFERVEQSCEQKSEGVIENGLYKIHGNFSI